MAVLKCTVCGGELDINTDLSVGVCKFCDSVITIPKELDKKGNLYNRAIFLRQNNEFDKALATYEDILREDNSDADAHWGLVLSKFGIEYVLDPKTQERKPTCHRTQTQSILSDPDYLAAIQYSDIEARKVIENEAKRINDIQTKILEISQKEEPYDIFICYKETDELGNRTEDSTLAQEIYYELKKKGYRVFFARKTLESKLGTEYEPIIFAALNSAKVMIVVGTKAEYFNAVWVKNEWSRFIHMSKDAHKTIIPAYRGISPYELPAELSSLQSQDMSKIGFMQDLSDGIERCMRGEIKKQNEVVANYGTTPVERLLQNSETYLKLNNFSSAEEVYTTVTKDYPEDYRGWWGLIVCKTRNFTEILPDQTTINIWFGYVKQLADAKSFENLENTYIEYTKKVSDLAATEDMRAVNGFINTYNNKINSIEQQKKNIGNSINSRIAAFRAETSNDNYNISTKESLIAENEKIRTTKTIKITIGVVGIIIGAIALFSGRSLFSGDWGILWGIVIGGIGVALCYSTRKVGTLSQIDQWITGHQNDLNNLRSAKEQHKIQCNTDVKNYNEQINNCDAEIANIHQKIADCKRYLELGKDKISTLWFSEKCALVGVKKSCDSEITELRKNAFGIKEATTEETVAITCPACGQKLIENRSKLIAQGSIVCKTCGNTIEVNVSDQATPEDLSNTNESTSDAFYNITCFACNSEFNIDSETLESGCCTCPNCGTEIEFKNVE